jgi:hypothetical protein
MSTTTLPALPPLPDLSAGAVTLPSLTDEELAVLGDTPALHDRDSEAAWAALDTPVRDAVATAVLRGLVARDLLTPQDEDLVLTDDIRLILAVRASPAFVTVADEMDATTHRPLRVHGIDLDDHLRYAALIEATGAGVHRFLLTTIQDAATRLVAWTLAPRDGTEVVTRSLEILHPCDDSPLYTRALVLAAHGSARIALLDDTGTAGDHLPATAQSLRTWLDDAWAGPR